MAKKKEPVWWHVDKQGRLIGWMWPEDFTAVVNTYYKSDVGMERFCYDYGLELTQVEDWLLGLQPIPKWAAVVASNLKHLDYNVKNNEPVIFPNWLPERPFLPNGRGRHRGNADIELDPMVYDGVEPEVTVLNTKINGRPDKVNFSNYPYVDFKKHQKPISFRGYNYKDFNP